MQLCERVIFINRYLRGHILTKQDGGLYMKRLISVVLTLCLILGMMSCASAGKAINDLDITVSVSKETVNAGETVTVTYQVTGGSAPYSVYANYSTYYDQEAEDDLNGGSLNKWNHVELSDNSSASGSFTITPTEGTGINVDINVEDANEESSYGYAWIHVIGGTPAPAVQVSIVPDQGNAKPGDTVSASYSVTAADEVDYLEVYVDQFDGHNVYGGSNAALAGKIIDTIRTATVQFDFDVSVGLKSSWSLFKYTKQFKSDATGSLGQAGWKQVGDLWYYGDETGTAKTGWQYINGYWYYFNDAGIMQTDSIHSTWDDNYDERTKQYLAEDGHMVSNAWFQKWGDWYYADAAGNLAEGWNLINGLWYYFNSSNKMLDNWRNLGGTWYHMNESGAMETGWKQEGGVWYYFTGDGAMATGWQQIGGTWYYFDASGAMATGWRNLGGWYYFTGDGAMATGWQQIAGTWYYFYGSGVMATGSVTIGDTVYTFDASGAWIG